MLVGAYGVGITVATLGWSMWLGSCSACSRRRAGPVLGVPTLRLRSDYFAITTIAVAEVLRLVVSSSWADQSPVAPSGCSHRRDFCAINPFPPGRYGIGLVSYTNQQTWALVVTWASRCCAPCCSSR